MTMKRLLLAALLAVATLGAAAAHQPRDTSSEGSYGRYLASQYNTDNGQ